MRWTNAPHWTNLPKNHTKGRSKKSPSLVIELFHDLYYINGYTTFVHLDAALEYAKKKLPKVPGVRLYLRRDRPVLYMHVRKPSTMYDCITEEKLAPKYAWDLFEAHAGMLR